MSAAGPRNTVVVVRTAFTATQIEGVESKLSRFGAVVPLLPGAWFVATETEAAELCPGLAAALPWAREILVVDASEGHISWHGLARPRAEAMAAAWRFEPAGIGAARAAAVVADRRPDPAPAAAVPPAARQAA